MTTQNLLVELFVEELPPKALKQLGEAFASTLAASLRTQGLSAADSVVTAYASPRRLAAHITHVAAKAADQPLRHKLMPVSVGLDASGSATPALLKKLQALVGVDVSDPATTVARLQRATDGKTEALFWDSLVSGATLDVGLQAALDEAIAKLPIPKVMTYQLHQGCELPGWSSVQFVRPAHGLVALHGETVVPVRVLGLQAGRSTHGHRFEAACDPIEFASADDYAIDLREEGSVIASFEERRSDILRQLHAAAEKAGSGLRPIEDDALLDEVTALVERPNVLVCQFEQEFLDVPQECLILTMKANQKYFPLLDTAGKLTNRFLVVSNICPQDASAVVGGNERVVRPRLADAKFFFDQDRKKTLESRVAGLAKVVYHNKLGTQGQRSERVQQIAHTIVNQLRQAQIPYTADAKDHFDALDSKVQQAARLAKTDLLTDMVGEFPELQGVMGGYYARHEGLRDGVAIAIEDHYKPRFAGDDLPRNHTGTVLALADKLETLIGMFGIGNLPTGDKDPFALRRHALGVIRILVEKKLPLSLDELLHAAMAPFGSLIADPANSMQLLQQFIYERLKGYFDGSQDRAQAAGAEAIATTTYSSNQIQAVLENKPQDLSRIEDRLLAVKYFAELSEASALAAANKRIGNILKKAGDAQQLVDAHVSEMLLVEEAEKNLYAAMQQVVPQADAHFNAGRYTESLQALAALRVPVDAFFDDVMVNAEQMDLRLNRQGLLKMLHQAMNRVADLSLLAI